MSKKIVARVIGVSRDDAYESSVGGLMFDSAFFMRKAQALLRFADLTSDRAIADRMRDQAARCHSQAELLSDDAPNAEQPLAPSAEQSTASR